MNSYLGQETVSREICSNHNRYGPDPIWVTQVMYYGMVETAQEALLTTFVCTAVYTTVENTGSWLTADVPLTRTYAIRCNFFCKYIIVKYVFWPLTVHFLCTY